MEEVKGRCFRVASEHTLYIDHESLLVEGAPLRDPYCACLPLSPRLLQVVLYPWFTQTTPQLACRDSPATSRVFPGDSRSMARVSKQEFSYKPFTATPEFSPHLGRISRDWTGYCFTLGVVCLLLCFQPSLRSLASPVSPVHSLGFQVIYASLLHPIQAIVGLITT